MLYTHLRPILIISSKRGVVVVVLCWERSRYLFESRYGISYLSFVNRSKSPSAQHCARPPWSIFYSSTCELRCAFIVRITYGTQWWSQNNLASWICLPSSDQPPRKINSETASNTKTQKNWILWLDIYHIYVAVWMAGNQLTILSWPQDEWIRSINYIAISFLYSLLILLVWT